MFSPLSYAIKIWATAVLACPVVMVVFVSLGSSAFESLEVLPCMILYGAVFSVPSMLFLVLAIHLLRDWDTKNYQYQKLALSAVCVVLTWLPFFLIDGSMSMPLDMACFIALYAAGTIAGVWIYNLHPKEELSDEIVAE